MADLGEIIYIQQLIDFGWQYRNAQISADGGSITNTCADLEDAIHSLEAALGDLRSFLNQTHPAHEARP